MSLIERDAYSIDEFCAANRIGRTTYYELKKTGDAPREMRIGKVARISREAAADWRRRMEAKSSDAPHPSPAPRAEQIAEAL